MSITTIRQRIQVIQETAGLLARTTEALRGTFALLGYPPVTPHPGGAPDIARLSEIDYALATYQWVVGGFRDLARIDATRSTEALTKILLMYHGMADSDYPLWSSVVRDLIQVQLLLRLALAEGDFELPEESSDDPRRKHAYAETKADAEYAIARITRALPDHLLLERIRIWWGTPTLHVRPEGRSGVVVWCAWNGAPLTGRDGSTPIEGATERVVLEKLVLESPV